MTVYVPDVTGVSGVANGLRWAGIEGYDDIVVTDPDGTDIIGFTNDWYFCHDHSSTKSAGDGIVCSSGFVAAYTYELNVISGVWGDTPLSPGNGFLSLPITTFIGNILVDADDDYIFFQGQAPTLGGYAIIRYDRGDTTGASAFNNGLHAGTASMAQVNPVNNDFYQASVGRLERFDRTTGVSVVSVLSTSSTVSQPRFIGMGMARNGYVCMLIGEDTISAGANYGNHHIAIYDEDLVLVSVEQLTMAPYDVEQTWLHSSTVLFAEDDSTITVPNPPGNIFTRAIRDETDAAALNSDGLYWFKFDLSDLTSYSTSPFASVVQKFGDDQGALFANWAVWAPPRAGLADPARDFFCVRMNTWNDEATSPEAWIHVIPPGYGGAGVYYPVRQRQRGDSSDGSPRNIGTSSNHPRWDTALARNVNHNSIDMGVGAATEPGLYYWEGTLVS